jgi:hypothetical protein
LQANIKHSVKKYKVLTDNLSVNLKNTGFNAKLLARINHHGEKSGFQCAFYHAENDILIAISDGTPSGNDFNQFNKKLIEFSDSGRKDHHFIWEVNDADSLSHTISKYIIDTFKIIGLHFRQYYLVGNFHAHVLSTEQYGLYDSVNPVPEFATQSLMP